MELPVARQLHELGLALVMGVCLALIYVLLRPLRRGRTSTAAADLVYVLVLPALLSGFALYAGRGRLRLFALAAMALSGALLLWTDAALRKKLKKIAKSRK